MCLAIFKPVGASVPINFLRRGFHGNPHGAGFAYAQNGVITMEKGFFSFPEFMEAYSKVPAEAPAMIHFRAATTGDINQFNCHPWQVNEEYFMIHNGIFGGFGNNRISDTGDYAANIVRPLFDAMKPGTDINSYWFRYYMRAAIGGYNKVVMLGKNGDFGIYNEFSGHRITSAGKTLVNVKDPAFYETVWYSNDYFLPTFNIVGGHEPESSEDGENGGTGKKKRSKGFTSKNSRPNHPITLRGRSFQEALDEEDKTPKITTRVAELAILTGNPTMNPMAIQKPLTVGIGEIYSLTGNPPI